MATQVSEEGRRTREGFRAGGSPGALLAGVLWLTSLSACNPAEPGEFEQFGQLSQAVHTDNGLSYNGLSYNGLSYNGLSYNGLSYNGLSYNGLSSAAFEAWFTQDPNMADQVMLYLVRCALPAAQTLTYTEPSSSQSYTWTGGLGLAPGWASGAALTVAEQQIITACLAAHTNKYQQHVPISVLGHDAEGNTIPWTQEELAEYSEREACFFGNLFTDEGVYAGSDRSSHNITESTSRACSITPNASNPSNCPPLIYGGPCMSFCTRDASRTHYTSCTLNGVTYVPLTTRLRPQDIFTCGDGVCQISESCGTGHQYNNCRADCGPCQ